LLRVTTLAAATVLGTPGWKPAGSVRAGLGQDAASTADDPQPQDPFAMILEATTRFPIVAIGEAHQLQEEHDFFQALLQRPDLPTRITDLVVEFGNARYQDVADRFVAGEPVANADLSPIWRDTIGGFRGVWDPPVYEQFFRTVRAVNWQRPPAQRLRVLLADPPIDFAAIQRPEDALAYGQQRDAHMAGVLQQEVLDQGRRALFIAGNGHLLRGQHADMDPTQLNAITQLDQQSPGVTFVIDLLLVPPGAPDQLATLTGAWARPAAALLAGTWLGETQRPGRAVTAAAARYAEQADAVLYLGGGDTLTASRAEPAIYLAGAYHDELERRNRLQEAYTGQPSDLVGDALQRARLGPSYFAD
jgi:hypothetical protein